MHLDLSYIAEVSVKTLSALTLISGLYNHSLTCINNRNRIAFPCACKCLHCGCFVCPSSCPVGGGSRYPGSKVHLHIRMWCHFKARKPSAQRHRVDGVAVCVFVLYYNNKTASCRTNTVQMRTTDAQVSSTLELARVAKEIGPQIK